MIRVALLPGDGIGAEVMQGPAELLRTVPVEVTGPWPIGSSAFAAHRTGLPEVTLTACEAADAILLGAVGDHPGVDLPGYRTELPLLKLREHFGLRISLRDIWRDGQRPLTIVRNLLGGAYGAESTRRESDGTIAASDEIILEPDRIAELAQLACGYIELRPGARLFSVDKANLFATSRLWRHVVTRISATHGIEVAHRHVDRAAFELASRQLPDAVLLTEGIFGDILSDLAAGRAGSIALGASASVHPGKPARGRCVGLFEPLHGSAPLHTGKNMANPAGAYLALASLLEWFPETADLAPGVRAALTTAMRVGPRTYDLAPVGGPVSTTSAFSERVNRAFELAS
ncbi:MAG: isocitrate/isopropylmalate family dehydrogenase [Candidatus Dormiibacterota bacterium]